MLRLNRLLNLLFLPFAPNMACLITLLIVVEALFKYFEPWSTFYVLEPNTKHFQAHILKRKGSWAIAS